MWVDPSGDQGTPTRPRAEFQPDLELWFGLWFGLLAEAAVAASRRNHHSGWVAPACASSKQLLLTRLQRACWLRLRLGLQQCGNTSWAPSSRQ